MVDGRVGVNDRVVTHHRAFTDVGARINARVFTDHSTCGHRSPGFDHRAGRNLGGRIDMSALANAACGHRTTGHDLQRVGKPGIGIFGDDNGTTGSLFTIHDLAVCLRNHQNARLRSFGFIAVLGLSQEGNGVGRRMIERRKRAHGHIFSSAQRRTRQSSFGERFNFTDQCIDSEHSVIS